MVKNLSVDAPDDVTSPKRLPKTGGEKLFNIGAYYGINYAGNTGISIYLTDKASNRQPGMFGLWQGLYDNRIKVQDGLQAFAKGFLKDPKERKAFQVAFEEELGPLTNQALYDLWAEKGQSFSTLASHFKQELGHEITPDTLKEIRDFVVQNEANGAAAKSLGSIVMLCTGGFLTLVPVKLLEDHKLPIVRFLDEHVVDPLLHVTGRGPSTEEEKAKLTADRQARYAQIEHEPHQTWLSELASRVAAILPIYAIHTVTAGEYNIVKSAGARAAGVAYANPDKAVGFVGFDHYLDEAGEKIGNWALKKFPDIHEPFGSKGFNSVTRFKQHAKWLAADSCYTWLSATGTYLGTRLFASALGKHEAQEAAAASEIKPFKRVNAGSAQGKVKEDELQLSPA